MGQNYFSLANTRGSLSPPLQIRSLWDCGQLCAWQQNKRVGTLSWEKCLGPCDVGNERRNVFRESQHLASSFAPNETMTWETTRGGFLLCRQTASAHCRIRHALIYRGSRKKLKWWDIRTGILAGTLLRYSLPGVSCLVKLSRKTYSIPRGNSLRFSFSVFTTSAHRLRQRTRQDSTHLVAFSASVLRLCVMLVSHELIQTRQIVCFLFFFFSAEEVGWKQCGSSKGKIWIQIPNISYRKPALRQTHCVNARLASILYSGLNWLTF